MEVQVGNYMSAASIEAGTYTYVRHTLSRTMEISGASATYTTTAATQATASSGTLRIDFSAQHTIEFDVENAPVIVFYPRPPSATITFE